jgi:hypothetical protein
VHRKLKIFEQGLFNSFLKQESVAAQMGAHLRKHSFVRGWVAEEQVL